MGGMRCPAQEGSEYMATCSHQPKAITFCGEAMGVVMPPMLLLPWAVSVIQRGSPKGKLGPECDAQKQRLCIGIAGRELMHDCL